jgi:integrase
MFEKCVSAHVMPYMHEREGRERVLPVNEIYCRKDIRWYLFKKLLKAAGLPGVRFHDLRHGAATVLLAANVVSELLGHSSVAIMANIYVHVLPEMQREVVNKMDDLYGHS